MARKFDTPPEFECLTLNDVRARAGEFERLAQAARSQEGSAPARPSRISRAVGSESNLYAIPAYAWRTLERFMREHGAWEVGDLPRDEVERWAKKLGVASGPADTYGSELAGPLQRENIRTQKPLVRSVTLPRPVFRRPRRK